MANIEKQIVHLNLPQIMIKEIDEYQIKNGLTTRTNAILELIRKGLVSRK
jgi:metal-responsive CopG/Arc/MetJ family transcriptional regulator